MAADRRNNSSWMIMLEILLWLCLSSYVLCAEPMFDTETEEVEVRVHSRALLPCVIENRGDSKVAWVGPHSQLLLYESKHISLDDRFSIVNKSTDDCFLSIENVSISDHGEYKCQLIVSPIQVKTVMLVVKSPVTISEEKSSGDVVLSKVGDSVSLYCITTGHPPPQVTWYKRSKPINDEPDGDMESEKCMDGINGGERPRGERLVITELSRSCSGMYECVASNGFDNPISKQIRLEVEFAPEIKLDYEQLDEYAGQDVILRCFIKGNPLQIYEWIFNSSRLIYTGKYKMEIHHPEADAIFMNLMISNLQPEDFGVYTCFAGNYIANSTSSIRVQELTTTTESTTTTTTTVQSTTMANVPPQIVLDSSSPSDIIAVAGDSVSLYCNATGYPEPDVTWSFRMGKKSKRKTLATSRELMINQVTVEDKGTYECIASNGISDVSHRVSLQVQYAPAIEIQKSEICQSKGREAILTCEISSNPHVLSSWRFGDNNKISTNWKYQVTRLPVDESVLSLSLIIKDISEEDFGEYFCVGSNQLGKAVESINLSECPTTTTTTTTTRRAPKTKNKKPKTTKAGKEQSTDPETEPESKRGSANDNDSGGTYVHLSAWLLAISTFIQLWTRASICHL